MAMSYASSRTQQSAPVAQQEPNAPELQPWGNAAMGEQLAGPGECAPEPERWGAAAEGGEAWWASEGEAGICAEGGTAMEQLETELQAGRPDARHVLELCLRLTAPEINQLHRSSLWERVAEVVPARDLQFITGRIEVFDGMLQQDPRVSAAVTILQGALSRELQAAVTDVLADCGGAETAGLQTMPLRLEARQETEVSATTARELGLSPWKVTVALQQLDFRVLLSRTGDLGELQVSTGGDTVARVEGDVAPEWWVHWNIPTFKARFDPVLGFHLWGAPGAVAWRDEA
jgi:hypothetical protein